MANVTVLHATKPILLQYEIGSYEAHGPRHPCPDRVGGRRDAGRPPSLAEALDTSPGFLSQAMTPMVNRGWVRSEPGRSGGYTAAVALEDVSVLDVVEAVEGPTDVTRCVLEDRACTGGGRCALHDAWAQARGHLLRDLAETPLSAIGSPRRPR